MTDLDRKIRTAMTALTSEAPPARPFETLDLGTVQPMDDKARRFPTWALVAAGSTAVFALVLSATFVFSSVTQPSRQPLAPAATDRDLTVDWFTTTLSEDAGPVADIVWNGSEFVVITETGRIFAQQDELTWVEVEPPSGELGSQPQLFAWQGRTIVLWSEANEGRVAVTEDLTSWEIDEFVPVVIPEAAEGFANSELSGFTIGAAGLGEELVVGFNYEYVVGPIESSEGATGFQYGNRSELYSAGGDLESWQRIELPFGEDSYLVQMWTTTKGLAATGAESWSALSQVGALRITTTEDGASWVTSDSEIIPVRNGPWQAVASDGDAMIMVTDQFCCGRSGGGEFYRSDDGEQWEPTLSTQQNDSPGFDRAVAAGELGFVIVADGVFYSPDAENWVELDISRTRTSVADRSNRVAVGDDIVIGLGGLDGSEGVGATQLLIGRVGGVEADAAFSCPITPLPSEAFTPPDPYVSERGDGMVWYGSDELWTVLQDDGVYVQRKSVWWSVNFPGGVFEEEPEIAVTWERLDAEAAPVTVSPGTNANTFEDGDFMIAGIDPDQSGCWRVTAEYKGATLSYVYERP